MIHPQMPPGQSLEGFERTTINHPIESTSVAVHSFLTWRWASHQNIFPLLLFTAAGRNSL
ncbi:hypothetical protein UUU_02810 [Klebsiella pneumoniae subsp. pneumoniae DSM 30104 = JCM 1662 = NBRC 14940]|nr:hypothetical protein UUU_02810 [Klebsiella pneumoniae subsp. pneumoniae DSM 30104 = JCM 1662 = NBRC 14940]